MLRHLPQLKILLLITALCPTTLMASESVQNLKDQVEATIFQLYNQNMSNFDSSKLQINYDNALQLFNQPKCTKTLVFERINSLPLGRQSILVRCHDQKPWSIYLPIEVNYRQNVVITNTNVSNNEAITRNDVILAERDIGKIRTGYYTDISEVIGKATRRNLKPGIILSASILQPPVVIQRGDAVQILGKSSTLVVKMQGVAMTSGRIGKQIQIRNKTSGKIIRARVVEAGIVEVVI